MIFESVSIAKPDMSDREEQHLRANKKLQFSEMRNYDQSADRKRIASDKGNSLLDNIATYGISTWVL